MREPTSVMEYRWRWVKQQWVSYKAIFYACLLMTVLAFLGQALYEHGQAIATIRITPSAWACFVIATGITLFAFIWTGWVWGWILRDLGHPVSNIWATQIYLTTNIAKYLPSNLVHLYGRTLAATKVDIPFSAASLSVILDTLLMISAGLILGLLNLPRGGLRSATLGLIVVLVVMHPLVLGFLIRWLTRLTAPFIKNKEQKQTPTFQLKRYPWRPLLGEIGIIILRGFGFALIVQSLIPFSIQFMPRLISIFSIGWLSGFITPGIPGGVGVFELTVSRLISTPDSLANGQTISYGLALGSVLLYRLMNTISEVLGAGLASLDANTIITLPIVHLARRGKPSLRRSRRLSNLEKNKGNRPI